MSMTQLLELERILIHEPDPTQRLGVLQDFRYVPVPEDSIVRLIVDVLEDAEPMVREEAALCLLRWERKAVMGVMTALRSTPPDKVDRRRLLIHMLGRFGNQAAIAETLLRAYDTDEHVSNDVKNALARIRKDWGNVLSGLGGWGLECLLLTATVAMPALGIAIRYHPVNQPFPWIPTLAGIAGGVAAILLARAACTVFNPRIEDERSLRIRRITTMIGLGIIGLVFGIFIGSLAVSSRATVDQAVPAGKSN